MAKRLPKPDAKGSKATKTVRRAVQIGPDRIQIEFLIDDLVKELIKDRGGLVANGCNGCSTCSKS